MADQKLIPTYPVPTQHTGTPRLVGHVIDDPVDDDEQQMGIMARNDAIQQEIHTWLIDRQVRALDRYDQNVLQVGADRGQQAKAVYAAFDGDTPIDDVMRKLAVDVLVSAADSYKRTRTAYAMKMGDVTDHDYTPTKKKQPEVIVQAGPKLKPAPVFTRKQKYVIDEE
jgi:hypothetical protein